MSKKEKEERRAREKEETRKEAEVMRRQVEREHQDHKNIYEAWNMLART